MQLHFYNSNQRAPGLKNNVAAAELSSWLALMRCPAAGSVKFQQALQHVDSLQSLFTLSQHDLKTLGFSAANIAVIRKPDQQAIERDLRWLEDDQHHFITQQDPRYPQLLREIPDAPLALYVTGDAAVLDMPQIALVGSRNPSVSGQQTAHAFAKALAEPGLAITSGLALGVDAQGHRGALDAGGITIAVTATGLDQVYPAQHRQLAEQIKLRGAIISEYPFNTPPRRYHFPKRNRIIAGLSLGTLVIEAAAQSGSLITAKMATEYNREVFAIPGSIHNPLARGCNALIRQGAKLVETAHDIAEEFAQLGMHAGDSISSNQSASCDSTKSPHIDADQQQLLQLVDFSPTTIDMLVERSGLRADEVASTLLILELNGLVASATGGLYQRTQT